MKEHLKLIFRRMVSTAKWLTLLAAVGFTFLLAGSGEAHVGHIFMVGGIGYGVLTFIEYGIYWILGLENMLGIDDEV